MDYILQTHDMCVLPDLDFLNTHTNTYKRIVGVAGYVTSFQQNQPNVGTINKEVNERLIDMWNKPLSQFIPGYKIKHAWYQRYKENDMFNLHNHGEFSESSQSLSAVIHCDNIGSTIFLNPNYLHSNNPELTTRTNSIAGQLLVFSSWIPHYVPPHRISGEERTIIAFNLRN